jgi:hypothetical protein
MSLIKISYVKRSKLIVILKRRDTKIYFLYAIVTPVTVLETAM